MAVREGKPRRQHFLRHRDENGDYGMLRMYCGKQFNGPLEEMRVKEWRHVVSVIEQVDCEECIDTMIVLLMANRGQSQED